MQFTIAERSCQKKICVNQSQFRIKVSLPNELSGWNNKPSTGSEKYCIEKLNIELKAGREQHGSHLAKSQSNKRWPWSSLSTGVTSGINHQGSTDVANWGKFSFTVRALAYIDLNIYVFSSKCKKISHINETLAQNLHKDLQIKIWTVLWQPVTQMSVSAR